MKSIHWKSTDRHVPLEDDGVIDDRGRNESSPNIEGRGENVKLPNESADAPSNRTGRNLVLKVFMAGLAIAALGFGVYAALRRNEIDTPGVVSSSAVFGDSSLRIDG